MIRGKPTTEKCSTHPDVPFAHVMILTHFLFSLHISHKQRCASIFLLKLWRCVDGNDASETQSTIFDNCKLWSTSRHICCIVSCSQKQKKKTTKTTARCIHIITKHALSVFVLWICVERNFFFPVSLLATLCRANLRWLCIETKKKRLLPFAIIYFKW